MTKQPNPQPGRPRKAGLRMPNDLHTAYANMARLAHTPSELVFDFARFLPGDAHATVASRVIMSPLGAKLFLNALTENIAKYEATHGEIKVPQQQRLADFLFRPPTENNEPTEPQEEDDGTD